MTKKTRTKMTEEPTPEDGRESARKDVTPPTMTEGADVIARPLAVVAIHVQWLLVSRGS